MTSSNLDELRTVKITADLTLVRDTLTELTGLLREASAELVDFFVDHIEDVSDLFVFETEISPTLGAREQRVVARPTERLAVLMSAMRAGNFDRAIIEQAFCHDANSSDGQGSLAQ